MTTEFLNTNNLQDIVQHSRQFLVELEIITEKIIAIKKAIKNPEIMIDL